MQRHLIAGLGLLAVSVAGQAADYDIDDLRNTSQANFRLLSEDLGAALSYKAVAPAEPLGLSGFDLALELSSTKVQNPEAWKDALGSTDAPSNLIVPRLHLHKGLPFGVDIGAFYATVPSTNIDLVGAELRYALLAGGTATPAIAVRATYSKLSGVEELAFDTSGVELSISKGFAMFTPYAGIGRVKINSEPQGSAASFLTEESFSQGKSYVGLNINLGLNIGLEADKTGDASSYSLKFGFRF